MICKPIYLRCSGSLKQKANDKTGFTVKDNDLTENMEIIEDKVRTMDVGNTAAVVASMAQLNIFNHQLAFLEDCKVRLYFTVTKDNLNNLC